MVNILFRPDSRQRSAPQPAPVYDETVNFQVSMRPPADFDLGLMKMSPANLPQFDSIEIYSKDAGGNVIGLWCECASVPTNTGIGTQCSGSSTSQNGASYEVRFKKNGAVVHTATAIISQLYSETLNVDFYFPSDETDWEWKAKVTPGNWPAGCSGMIASYVPGFPTADDCFELSAAAMVSGAMETVNVIDDPSFHSDFVIEAYDGSRLIYRALCNVTIHDS